MKKLELDGLNKEYLIDEDGNIFDIKENKYRKPCETEDGYLKVSFYINGKYKRKLVHRLVLMTFNPIDNMENLQVNHIDGNKKNNNVNNLEWCTQLENLQHAWRTGLCENSTPSGEQAHHLKLDEKTVKLIINDLLDKKTFKIISNTYNISMSTVYQIKHKITWKYLTTDINFFS